MTIELWHCHNARSLRALWALEEMNLEYKLHMLPFPPRVRQREFLEINALGTVPFMKHGDVEMTESSAIPLYLVERFGKFEFGLKSDHPEYGSYLNWLFHSDATLTFPQTIYLRYRHMEPQERGLREAGEDYKKWFQKRLMLVSERLKNREFLVDDRFTVADIDIAYALFLGEQLRLSKDYDPWVEEYLQRLKARPAFRRSVAFR